MLKDKRRIKIVPVELSFSSKLLQVTSSGCLVVPSLSIITTLTNEDCAVDAAVLDVDVRWSTVASVAGLVDNTSIASVGLGVGLFVTMLGIFSVTVTDVSGAAELRVVIGTSEDDGSFFVSSCSIK